MERSWQLHEGILWFSDENGHLVVEHPVLCLALWGTHPDSWRVGLADQRGWEGGELEVCHTPAICRVLGWNCSHALSHCTCTMALESTLPLCLYQEETDKNERGMAPCCTTLAPLGSGEVLLPTSSPVNTE